MAAPKSSINLLTAEIRPQGKWDKIYAWTANTAKYIIIITEIVVLGAIAFRFVVDGRIAALDREIEIQKGIMSARSSDEAQLKKLVTSLTSIKAMEESNYSLSRFYEQIQALIPASVTVQTVSVDISSCVIAGQVSNYESLLLLENNLKQSEFLENVTMSANQSAGGAINFTASFNLKFQTE
ncbi:MAG: hypothetical protein QY312_02640 [Candidatus Dojkabacteria bacterium]|nr:MAG: hypothetical protein QY312_02640 [Candidatus Dojkabacteria bacterium]